jgi:Ca-activated chloride channel homolog
MLAAQSRIRTLFILAGIGSTLLASMWLHSRPESPKRDQAHASDDGVRLAARLATGAILRGPAMHDLAVTIAMPGLWKDRAPIALAIVIDRSSSMTDGETVQPLRDAKAAAKQLIAQLANGDDSFAVVTYSSSDETVVPLTRVSEASRVAAMRAIDAITAEGSTCISCGLARGTAELAGAPARGVRRVVLISDGQANLGICERTQPGGLEQMAAASAANSLSISTVGVGLEFDEAQLIKLATVGRGNYYFAEDTRALAAMFDREMRSLAETQAVNAQLVVTDSAAARVVGSYGYPLRRVGDHVLIPVADLVAGELRKVVLRLQVAPGATVDAMRLVGVELGWQRPNDGANRHATAVADVAVVDDAAEVAATVDAPTVRLLEQARSAGALEDASAAYDQFGPAAAIQVLEVRGATVRANRDLDAAARDELDAANRAAIETLQRESGARVQKVNRVRAYLQSR